MRPVGKVYLVGAGPGHPELMTAKALSLLARADAVVFDRLVQEEVLAACRSDAERVYVGKRSGCHESRQSQINELLVDLAGRHQVVVRLKGGDPLVFGRGGEEAERLADAGVPFEIIPGVCSALAAPAAAGIPVTHRELACSLAVVTGHEKDGASDGRIDWEALARVDTLVVLMGVHALERIAQRLIAAGRAPETPAALVETAFWAGERVVEGTLATIAAEARAAKARPPATLVVGEVVTLRRRLGCGERELKRSSEQQAPGPSPTELGRFVGALRDAKHLLAALELDLFDHLTGPCTPAELAHARGLSPELAQELVAGLVRCRLLVQRGDKVWCGELAGRYLVRAGSEYVGQALREEMLDALSFDPLEPHSAAPEAAPHAVLHGSRHTKIVQSN